MPRGKILIAEDEKLTLDMLRCGLEENGFEVITASNGFEAILAVENQSPDIVVTDIMMPRLNGIDLLRALKNNGETRDIPVMLISAVDDVELIRKGLALGAVDYITKPFKINEIVGKLGHHLS